jgi:tetratricopeptide (TPR) repeat protein
MNKSWHGKRLRVATGLAAVVAGFLTLSDLQALYVKPDIENVPVERLAGNLEKLAQKDAKAVEPRFNLARLHAMAYALKTDTASVLKNKEDRGAWFGYEPKHVPFTLKKTDDEAKLKAAKEQLKKAITRYEEVIKLAADNLPARLGLAWCLEQSGDKEAAVKAYRKVIEDGWAKEKDLKRAPLGWHSITAEAAGYLMPLLDADKNKDEIATLKDRIAQMRKVPRPITPVAIPLRDGLSVGDLEDRGASVRFDADGTGLEQQWTWITPDAGWLVYDPQRKGEIASALQLFGNVTFWCFWENGYHALQALDNDGDGRLTGKELDGLSVWHDTNGNGVSEPGEVQPLAEYGIVALSCRYQTDARHPDRIAYSREGVTFRDGTSRPTYDLVLQRR